MKPVVVPWVKKIFSIFKFNSNRNMEQANEENNSSANDEIDKTWDKIERDSKKAGYRDGLSDGRESNFQKNFDEGYKQGFRNGFNIGKEAALQLLGDSAKRQESVKTSLEKSTSGWCQLCELSEEELQETSVSEAIQKQIEYTNRTLQAVADVLERDINKE